MTVSTVITNINRMILVMELLSAHSEAQNEPLSAKENYAFCPRSVLMRHRGFSQ